MLPYGKQTIEHDDIRAVVEALQSDWLTTGPLVEKFETEFARVSGVANAVSVSNGTAALHATMFAADLGPGDEVIIPAITFAATANAVLYQSAQPVFADVDSSTLLIDPDDVRRKITPRTRAIVAVDYAGQPCDYAQLKEIASEFDLILIADACHSLGGSFNGQAVGSLADMSCFSFHPVKPITCGEGGVVTTADSVLAKRMRAFRNHGINLDHRQRVQANSHCYDMEVLGFNYRLTDLQCALALSQLGKLQRFTRRRNQIAQLYDGLFAECDYLTPLAQNPNCLNAYHLYVVQWDAARTGIDRDEAFANLRANGIGVNVHYRPVYQHSYYQSIFGDMDHQCPRAEAAYERILTLPVFPSMTDGDVIHVVDQVGHAAELGRRIRSAA